MKNKNIKVYSVFPLCGKTYSVEKLKLNAYDSDSSKFSWVIKDNEKIRNPEFPKNYINHIKDVLDKYDYVFVSTHKEVRDALDKNNIPFALVYPEKECLNEWLKRYDNRSYNGFTKQVLKDNWDLWQRELNNQKSILKFRLKDDEYLYDILK